jgi:hypothetical protein
MPTLIAAEASDSAFAALEPAVGPAGCQPSNAEALRVSADPNVEIVSKSWDLSATVSSANAGRRPWGECVFVRILSETEILSSFVGQSAFHPSEVAAKRTKLSPDSDIEIIASNCHAPMNGDSSAHGKSLTSGKFQQDVLPTSLPSTALSSQTKSASRASPDFEIVSPITPDKNVKRLRSGKHLHTSGHGASLTEYATGRGMRHPRRSELRTLAPSDRLNLNGTQPSSEQRVPRPHFSALPTRESLASEDCRWLHVP